ncbi:MAG: hypothetical protein ACR2IK_15605, partial [Chloroflexota bacterium]
RLLALAAEERQTLIPLFQFSEAGRPYAAVPPVLRVFAEAEATDWTLPATRPLYRIHRRNRSPGTSTLGRQGRLIDPTEVGRRVLSTLQVPEPMVLVICRNHRP